MTFFNFPRFGDPCERRELASKILFGWAEKWQQGHVGQDALVREARPNLERSRRALLGQGGRGVRPYAFWNGI